jgi:hypothetical protein
MRSLVLAALLLLFILASPALATDGALEINQSCAESAGCFPGDIAGFPVQITSPGSYTLTGNLSVSGADTSGIIVEADDVTVDLNGFQVAGPGTCTDFGPSIACSSGTGRGIEAQSQARGTQVRNGAVRGFEFGVTLNDGSIVEGLTSSDNSRVGIVVNSGSVIGCTATTNGVNGITANSSSVTQSQASNNGASGIAVNGGSAIGNVVHENGGDGIRSSVGQSSIHDNVSNTNWGFGIRCGILGGATGDTQDGCIIAGNAVRFNQAGGIVGRDAVAVRSNTIISNQGDGIVLRFAANVDGNTVFKNTGNGISVNSSSTVIDNTMRVNGGFGLFFLGSQSAYRGNTISVNTGGTVGFGVGNTAVDTGQNLCNGSLTCP